MFDNLNTPAQGQAAAREQLLTLLKTLDPASPIAIYALGDELHVVHDFTWDPTVLKRALEDSGILPSTLLADSQSALARASTPMKSYALYNRIEVTLQAMKAIASRLAQVPGRKNLIWVSGAFPLTAGFDLSGLTGSAERSAAYARVTNEAVAAIDRANVAVYPVDPRGTVGKPGTGEIATMQLFWPNGPAGARISTPTTSAAP